MSDQDRGLDAPNPYALSETITTLGRQLQSNITDVMNAETNRIAGMIGNEQIQVIEQLKETNQQITALTNRIIALTNRTLALESSIEQLLLKEKHV